uniref:Protein shuttle craft n=1 Tax=Photinus pyralis TaxID=7054 RepID=A0A1Y1JZ76_PHOPY
MSDWDPNSRRPFSEGRRSYRHNDYNNAGYNPYGHQNGIYNVAQYNPSFLQSTEYYNRPTATNMSRFQEPTMASHSGLVNNVSLDGNQPHSSVALRSNLTPYAKEFTPSHAHSNGDSYGDKKQGAVKKRTFWNRDRRFDGSKQNHQNFQHNNENSPHNYENSRRSNEYNNRSRTFEEPRQCTDYGYNSRNGKSGGYYRNNNGNNNRNSYRRDYYDNRRDDYYKKPAREVPEKYEKRHSNKVDTFKKKPNENYEKKGKQQDHLKKKLDAASQRERLEHLILCRLLECLVCCEKLRHNDQIWSCGQCYHILHLNCTIKWAQSSKMESGWRCPACQKVYQEEPFEYRCYCEKQVHPSLDPSGIPHSCGSICGRKGRACSHTCTLICHPGPCPDCSVMVPKTCACSATQLIVKCGSNVPVKCENMCNKFLECGIHRCVSKCHEGDCNTCGNVLRQECYCGKEGRKVNCTNEAGGELQYECGETCEKLLTCGNHKCERKCHNGSCDVCPKSPSLITTCPCGQTNLVKKRKSCLDPIPCCDKICSKPLTCGQPSEPHRCEAVCHQGPCAPCPKSTIVRCRCGQMDKKILCVDLTSKADDARCSKKCQKRRQCGKHRCNQQCCIEFEHICPLPCNRLLSCGQHNCAEPCHIGRCPPCWRTSFDELYCECGASVLFPPVACGTRPPPCHQVCSRPRSCEHEAHHTCHPGPCPPCVVLTTRWCYGKHEQRSTIPCHQKDFSCGLPCGKDMRCGKHKCIQTCHKRACPQECNQACAEPRNLCGHPCNAPCHQPPCPEAPCKQQVQVTCPCGLRKSTRICMDLSAEYQNMAMSQLASKIEQIQMGNTVDVTDLANSQKRTSFKLLDCNEDCRLVERNRRLAIGLQIRNPDLSAKLMPRYSDYMRGWAKKDTKFCQYVHEKLTELVQLAKQSKQKSRAHSFETMNREKRHFVHEYCEHFGCDSAAYDPEPNRNVVATAYKDKSWLPSYSLLEVIQRENGQRKVPGPQQLGKVSTSKTETVSFKLPGHVPRPATPPGEYVDYFNNPPI